MIKLIISLLIFVGSGFSQITTYQSSPSVLGAQAIPPQVTAAGYNTQTFFSSLAASDFDLSETYPTGKKWYFTDFFNVAPAAAATVSFSGPVTAVGGNMVTTNISTIGLTSVGGSNWVGTAFGGGFYLDAVLNFGPTNCAANQAVAWPSLWAFSFEHIVGNGLDQWPGQTTGMLHFAEMDVMECDVSSKYTNYGATNHEFWGIYNTTCAPSNFCQISTGSGGNSSYSNNVIATNSDLASFHDYGVLWVPATSTNSLAGGAVSYSSGGSSSGVGTCYATATNGGGSGAQLLITMPYGSLNNNTSYVISQPGSGYTSMPTTWTLSSGSAYCGGVLTTSGGTLVSGYNQYFFDGQPVSFIGWQKYAGSSVSPPPGLTSITPWSFGVIDSQHFAIILSTGNNSPMNVQYVRVMQASAAGNLHQ